jgi:predicted O-methyltransferase YrrM
MPKWFCDECHFSSNKNFRINNHKKIHKNNYYKYTKNWFLSSEIKIKLLNFLDKTHKNTILEIGCYEGLSSVFFADNLLNNEQSSLTCVDPFLTIDNNDHEKLLNNNEENNFDYNIKKCKNSEKITVHKIISDDFFKINNKKFNFIYIDGSHVCENIKRDMDNSFNYLLSNGIMWMDDYLGGDAIKIKKTMDDFLDSIKGKYKIIHKDYQLAIMKL